VIPLPTVLIVDDREQNLVAFTATLEGPDRRVLTAGSAREALELLLVHEVALAIVDVQMPEIDGFELAELMRGSAKTQTIPIIFVTAGHHDQRRVFAGYELGAVDFLTKPIEPRVLRGKADVFLELCRKRQQLACRVAELEALLSAVPAAVFMVTDARPGEVLANDFASRLLGLPAVATEDEPRPYRRLRHDEGAPVESLPLAEVLATGTSRRDCELGVTGADGRALVLYGNASTLRDPAGTVRGAVGAFVDVTRIKQVEAQLIEADRQKDEFLAALSHELRNPLMPIVTSVEILKRFGVSTDSGRRALEVVERQSKHLTRLVEDLLDMTRIRNGKVRLQPAPADLVEVMRHAGADHRAAFAAAAVELELQLPDRPVVAEVDAARMLQVVGNLLGNAAKFTPRGGKATLALEVRADAARIVVTDDGAGMAPDTLARLFRPFSQADRTLDRSRGGLGLGLAVVKQLVEMQGGSVQATSRGVGCGSEFVVEVPLATDATLAAETSRLDDGQATIPRRVLLVEDSPDGAAMFSELVRMDGHDVAVAHDGLSAIDVARRHLPHIVFCDIGLPGLDGYEVARRLRRELARVTRLVAVTGYATPCDRERALAAGFDEHLAKPPPRWLVRAAIARAPLEPAGASKRSGNLES
jgi:signal transduction histidine kinase/ActR/RegA family two-component response regulator